MTGTHVNTDALAALAEGALSEAEAGPLRDHLATCRTCMAAYADAVRYRAAWLSRPEAFEPDGELVDLAGRVAVRSSQRSRRTRSWAPMAFAATGAAALGAWAVLANLPEPSLPLEHSPAVRRAIERSSAEGLVLPGGARAAARDPGGLRSGQGIQSPELESELRRALAAYEGGERDAEAGARLLAAFLAGGELDAAATYVEELLAAHPNHVPTLVLAADVEFRRSRLASAERLLSRALERSPRDPAVQLDLALVLRQRGREPEAQALLERALRGGDSAIAMRVRRELDAAR